MDINEFQSLTELGADSSRIANDLMALISDSDQREEYSSSDLLTLSDDGTMVAIRVTVHDMEQVTPALEELGFEVIGSAPEHHLLEDTVGESRRSFENLCSYVIESNGKSGVL